MSKDEFYTIFPYDIYKNENDIKVCDLGETVYNKTDSTNQQWPITKLAAGWYKVVAIAKDKNGEEVRAEKYVEILNELTDKQINQAISVIPKSTNLQPGQKAEYTIATGFDKIWLIHTLSKMDKTNPTTYLTITKSQSASSALLTGETDRGGIALNYAFVQHNRVYKGNENFSIPWSNKDLQITYNTFRDKLLPGANEKWSVKISGNKGEKLAAEVLASMYDASLDQFKPHSWDALNIWPGLNNTVAWQENGFAQVNSEEFNQLERTYYPLEAKSYDGLLNDYYNYEFVNRRMGKVIKNRSQDN
ncbi:MAG: hypothetical protein IPP48_06560 [Chitinophagaceae bacterium]|nr:hypothetical protein [Chitinophagaceae bacterium]